MKTTSLGFGIYCTACMSFVAAPFFEHQRECRPPNDCPPVAPEGHSEMEGTANGNISASNQIALQSITASTSGAAVFINQNGATRPFYVMPGGGVTLNPDGPQPIVISVRLRSPSDVTPKSENLG